jgi:hypothetical protein
VIDDEMLAVFEQLTISEDRVAERGERWFEVQSP